MDANMSLSARRAWIEIGIGGTKTMAVYVALRKESVDRNYPQGPPSFLFGVALRKESVDRNNRKLANFVSLNTSLSARRAWIEILREARICRSAGSRSPQGERG